MTKPNSRKTIYVYADWAGLEQAELMGVLAVDVVRGSEMFSFEYNKQWLTGDYAMQLDPELFLYTGDQFVGNGKANFGVFMDSCPDRWGRMLMKRREAILARQEKREERFLHESDFLLGVFDSNRMGGLRFKLNPNGEFLNDNKQMASPPWANLRELEYASLKLEQDDAKQSPEYLKWLNMLVVPGSSLGGARPKSSVVDDDKNLWIAKFPSKADSVDTGAWEMVAHLIAQEAGVDMAECRIQKFNREYHTFLTRRFDRKGTKRIHFTSAMTALAKNDRDIGTSYLELAEFITHFGCNIEKDLEQLWRRIVLNICISNVDDHLRNHGFLLEKKGWRLSPAFDINPNRDGNGLNLNISQFDNSQDLTLAMSVIGHFRLNQEKALSICKQVKQASSKWQKHANQLNLPTSEQDYMSNAFIHSLE